MQYAWETSGLISHHLKSKFWKTRKYVLTFFGFGNKLRESRPSSKKKQFTMYFWSTLIYKVRVVLCVPVNVSCRVAVSVPLLLSHPGLGPTMMEFQDIIGNPANGLKMLHFHISFCLRRLQSNIFENSHFLADNHSNWRILAWHFGEFPRNFTPMVYSCKGLVWDSGVTLDWNTVSHRTGADFFKEQHQSHTWLGVRLKNQHLFGVRSRTDFWQCSLPSNGWSIKNRWKNEWIIITITISAKIFISTHLVTWWIIWSRIKRLFYRKYMSFRIFIQLQTTCCTNLFAD